MRNNDGNNSYNTMIVACICGASIVILAFLGMLVHNNQKKADLHKKSIESVAEAEEVNDVDTDSSSMVDELISDNQLVSSDLDFWDMYEEIDDSSYLSGNDNKKTKSKKKVDDLDDEITESENSESDADDIKEDIDYEDEYHIAIVDDDGEKIYYEIMEDVPKNKYNFSEEFEYKDKRLKYKGEEYLCYSGIDISKYQGAIDFTGVKAAGVDFAMIRVAYRGSTTGQIALDDNFVSNANSAKAVGIPIGAYFYTQALTENEAIEEANFAAAAIGNFGVTYPVAIDVEFSKSPGDRASKLSVDDRTKCVKAFMDTINNLGYKPMLYASKEMLISGLDVSELTEYDVWLSDPINNEQVYTNYPYSFSMWQYDITGSINGINNAVDLDIYLIKKEDN